jgi:hypothetical protein
LRLSYQLCLPSSHEVGDEFAVGDRDFDHSGMRPRSPEVLFLVSAGVFSEDFGGDLYLGFLTVGKLADPVLAASAALVTVGFAQFGVRRELRQECDGPSPSVHNSGR